MNDNKDNNGQEYKGLSKTASVLGQSAVDGYKGAAVGVAAGAVAGAIMHNKETHEAAVEAGTGGLKQVWHRLGRGGKAGAVALAGAAVIGTVGQTVGYFRGAKKADGARQQFNEITSENKNLKEKLTTSEANIAQIQSVVAQVEKPAEKSHVATLEAQRSQQNHTAALG